jgi:membrane fusion protein (multidrug efflux system)
MTFSLSRCRRIAWCLPLLVISACGKGEEEGAKKGGPPRTLRAEGFVVKAGQFESSYTTSGTLMANEQIQILPEVSGRVTNINFTEGSVVRKGQTLLTLSDADIQANIRKLQAQRANLRTIQNRQTELVRIGGLPRQDLEATQTNIQSIDADIAFQQAQQRKLRIVAPFDGIVGLRMVSEGAIVSPSSVVAQLQQVNPLKLDFTLPTQYRNAVRSGVNVQFTVTGMQDTFSATIKAVDPGADMGTRALRARALFPNPDRKLSPGQFARVSVPLQSSSDAILIPSQAVIPTTREKKVALVKGGKVEMRTVVLGTRTEDEVEVVQGLAQGDTILVTGLMQAKQGAEVQVTKVR